MRYLLLILHTNVLVLARKRGVRQPRQKHNSHRTLEIEQNIFAGHTIYEYSTRNKRVAHDDEQASEADEPILNFAPRNGGKGGKENGGNKATGSRRSSNRGSSGKTPTIMPSTSMLLDIPPRNSPNLCRANLKGTFGSERGDEYVIHYIYQVEVEPGTTVDQLKDKILPSIEMATVNFMIPYMFEPLCGSFRRLQVLGLLQPEESRYLGIATSPVDQVSENGECGTVFLQPCYIVSGFMTTYSAGKNLEEVEGEVSTLLESVFGVGNLATSVPGVDGVAFRGMAPGSSTPSPTPMQTLGFEIPEPSPIFLSPISPTFRTPTAPPTTDLPTNVPTIQPISPTIPAPTPLQPTELPTKSPTFKPTLENGQQEAVEDKSSGDDNSVGGLSAWWRWLVVCLVVIFMVVAIVVVYRGCPDKSKNQHQSFDQEEGSRELKEEEGQRH